ncbi:TPA: hypothetical protein DDW69_00415 [candidate division CPR2 bacterium]|uniref:Transglutaminase-like domain-containing protein n=1 Tax=candidate division CPR2 bacterium GW2011_GWC1_41_48 TaxID=1618344 RepID=A0A0G0W9R9_UNCC2|nr:MAG: hypothetical protein UT47_C0004G0107 [candidate division CPR2 bacterium GW2011_GWC2_39_35]KKR27111.1 MAG: hypothetical protein UT59_C0069G0002 [candidate division CPR2 bacterium GW2011_GWD1_39_7]KKR28665.1 MAG: hypothetical protein UT60_C0015G0019 [candidate division CPR2 bacterium GW2011_GWD2_39_7]KKS08802.1 MAG: hypothetical protein UU65_C0004G0013 [candidate division CPR2 bacterium GW2011_GWC1_41_48]OGB72968.1 MAG: hypothetical protein A2Y26_02550 [candidate division CPR2 bacterium G
MEDYQNFNNSEPESLNKPPRKKRIGLKLIVLMLPILSVILGFYILKPSIDTAQIVSKIPVLEIFNLRKFPALTEPKQITLNCDYHGQKLILNKTLYQSVDDYYGSEPKKSRANSKDDYASLVFSYPEDDSLKQIVADIKAKGVELGLTADQTADLATCFIQTIPYDQEKAKKVLSHNPGDLISSKESKEISGRYPYETLFDNMGICTDKSYLAAAVLKELGYGTVLFEFDKDRHMAIGIKTPLSYSSFNSGYSYIETTNVGYKVGQLPIIDEKGFAQSQEIETLETGVEGSSFLPEIKEGNISSPSKTVKVSDGNEYQRVIEFAKTHQRIKDLIVILNKTHDELLASQKNIEALKAEVNTAENIVAKSESAVKESEQMYKSTRTTESYSSYLSAYNNYKNDYNDFNVLAGQYNQAVNNYNGNVEKFNGLINEYNALINQG